MRTDWLKWWHTSMDKPYAESCDQNRDPILKVLSSVLRDRKTVLEIGSGTGQHAVYFSKQLPYLTWQTSDRESNLNGINMWLDESGLSNVRKPIELDVSESIWPEQSFDAVFTANTVHIMCWEEVRALYSGVGERLHAGGLFVIYGPFNYADRYTSESNRRFDEWLKGRDYNSGIKNFEDLCLLAQSSGLQFVKDVEMPANNRILIWQRQES